MRKFLFLTSHIPYPPDSGDKIGIFNTVCGLISAGHQVEVLSLYDDLRELEHQKQLCEKLGIHVRSVRSGRKLLGVLKAIACGRSMVFERFFSRTYLRVLQGMSGQFDVLYAHHSYMAQYLELLGRVSAKRVCDLHILQRDIFYERSQKAESYIERVLSKVECRRLKKTEVETLRSLDRVFCYGEKECQALKEAGVDMATYRPIPVKTGEVDSIPGQGKTESLPKGVFAFFGDYAWFPNRDGLRYILDYVWPSLIAAYPTFKLLLAGRNAPEWLESYDGRLNVRVCGEVPSISQFLSGVEFILSPIRVGGGVRLKVIEGMAAGKVVIANAIAAEGILDKQLLLDFEDEDFLGEIGRLCESPGSYSKLAQKSLEYATAFHSLSNSTAFLLEKIYEGTKGAAPQ